MPSSVAIFLDFNLPNTTTWFYFSFFLAIAIFFKFTRLLSVRNLDVVMFSAPGSCGAGRSAIVADRQQPPVQIFADRTKHHD